MKRRRLERVLYLMSRAPGRTLTEVALECGFSSSSDFSRSFKSRYGSASSVFDVESFRKSQRERFDAVMESHERPISVGWLMERGWDTCGTIPRSLRCRIVGTTLGW